MSCTAAAAAAAAEEEEEVEAEENVCANCGIAGVDGIKLKECDGCESVRYCSDKCREEHREQHDEECKKRADELHDKLLFTEPEGTYLGECPICFLPMSLDEGKSGLWRCCSTIICVGCIHTSQIKHGDNSCPNCRFSADDDEANNMKEYDKRRRKRVEANDPIALLEMGTKSYEEDPDAAIEYWTKAAELGDVTSHHQLGIIYWKGDVVEKDDEKAVYHFEKAAIAGHPGSRLKLWCIELENGNERRAMKHIIIAAKLGCDLAMKGLWTHYFEGIVTKEDLDATLRVHHAAIDATKSPQREAAAKYLKETNFFQNNS